MGMSSDLTVLSCPSGKQHMDKSDIDRVFLLYVSSDGLRDDQNERRPETNFETNDTR